MDSSPSPLSDQIHKDNINPLLPGPTAVKARPSGPSLDADARRVSPTISPEHIDVTAEESCPAPAAQMSAPDSAPQPAPAVQPAKAPSATTFELMNQLDALAADLAVKGRASSDQSVENVNVPEQPKFSGGLQAVEPSIRVPPRPASFENDPFVSDSPLMGKRKVRTLASLFMAAVIGVGVAFAWHTYSAWTMKSPNDVDVAAGQSASTPAATTASASDGALPQSAAGTQTATPPTEPAASAELVKQLEAMTQDLTFVRRTVEQLAAKQEQLAAAQQQLEQLAAKQEQLTAKQEQMAQNIAKLQTREQNVRPKTSPPPQSRAAPAPPRAPPEPAAQLSSAPRSAPQHPVPPLPVPPAQ